MCGGECLTYGGVSGCSVGAPAASQKRLPPMPPRSVWLGVGGAGVHPHPSHPTPPPLLTLQVWRGHRPRSGRLPVRGDRLLQRPLRGNPAWVARLRLVDGRRFGARPEWNTGCALSLELVLHVALAAEPNTGVSGGALGPLHMLTLRTHGVVSVDASGPLGRAIPNRAVRRPPGRRICSRCGCTESCLANLYALLPCEVGPVERWPAGPRRCGAVP